jgi:formylmethanofuran dehydrogenase subunit C
VFAALLCAGLSSSACSSDPGGSDERSCQGEVGASCPATFDEVLTGTWTCQDRENIWAGECMTGGPLTLNHNFGTHQTNCFYDPTSRQLVGANTVNDTPVYCNNTSASMSQGTVPVPYPHYCVGGSAGTVRSMSCAQP